jgi:hypothetical protein
MPAPQTSGSPADSCGRPFLVALFDSRAVPAPVRLSGRGLAKYRMLFECIHGRTGAVPAQDYPHCPHPPTSAAWQRGARADRLTLGGKEMENWRDDLNSLVDETMTFVKSVREPPLPRTIVESNRTPSVNWRLSEREEVEQRIANFRAHQERFMREREDYATSLWKRIRT